MLSGQGWLVQANLGRRELIEESGPVGFGNLVPSLGKLRYRGLALRSSLLCPVVHASQRDIQARSQVLFGLVQDLECLVALLLHVRQPGEDDPVLQVLGFPCLGRAQKGSGIRHLTLPRQHVNTEQGRDFLVLGPRLLGLAQSLFDPRPVALIDGLAEGLLDPATSDLEPQLRLAVGRRDQDRQGLINLARFGQGPGQCQTGCFRSIWALTGVAECGDAFFFPAQARVALGQHQVELHQRFWLMGRNR